MSLSTAHPWSPLSLMFQPRMGLSLTTQHVTLGHFMSHHIFQSTYVYGAFTSCQTLFQAVGTQKREHWSKIPAQDLPSTGENKQDRCIFKTVINTKKEKKKTGKGGRKCVCLEGYGGTNIQTGSSGSKLCELLATDHLEEEAVRGGSSEMNLGRLEGCGEPLALELGPVGTVRRMGGGGGPALYTQ